VQVEARGHRCTCGGLHRGGGPPDAVARLGRFRATLRTLLVTLARLDGAPEQTPSASRPAV
jgi:hypothetical protein